MLTWLLVFAAAAGLDIVWTRYIQAVGKDRVLAAGLWSALIFVCGGYVTVSYVNDAWLLIPAALGAFAGTVIAMKIKGE